jgi:CubicO group peptidase (beta-lactamase class C family)
MATPTRTREDWLRAARLALLKRGADGVRVEPLAAFLGVTKGSFYWHFIDRAELLEALLVEWEEETRLLTDALRSASPIQELPAILDELGRLNRASERGESPSDAAIFAWAAVDPKVAKRANRAERERMRLFRRLTGKHGLADLFYYAYHGFLLRRRRVPGASGDFASLARIALRVLASPAAARRARRASAFLLGAVFAATSLSSCTTMRIIRHRDPAADRPKEIFHQRAVEASTRPAPLIIATTQRTDLDTVRVRDVDFQMRPLAEYLERRQVRAFIVVRDDTVLYEHYSGGYDAGTTSSSFSVAKSFTSALLGQALANGTVRSLDDSVTRYIPELGANPAYRGVTLRQLLGMRSGIAYTRTNGGMWHDLRSSDAQFFYTSHMDDAILDQEREDPPGLRWAYKDSDAELLGWVLERATGKTLARQLEDGIWRPIGTEHAASWDLDRKDGREHASSGLNATARDLVRFGRLYLDGGKAEGRQVVPREWVEQSTTLDATRTEPEVATWWLMQHQQYWWIPMQNWDAERDFFADGSRGQRIYVHPRSRIVIVQLANDSAQDFPFRKIVHHLLGEPFRYPVSIPRRLLTAATNGAGPDAVKQLFVTLTEQAQHEPASFVITEAGMIAAGQQLLAKKEHVAAGIAMLELAVERSPKSFRAREALGQAYEAQGMTEKARAAYRAAVALDPHHARVATKFLAKNGG